MNIRYQITSLKQLNVKLSSIIRAVNFKTNFWLSVALFTFLFCFLDLKRFCSRFWFFAYNMIFQVRKNCMSNLWRWYFVPENQKLITRFFCIDWGVQLWELEKNSLDTLNLNINLIERGKNKTGTFQQNWLPPMYENSRDYYFLWIIYRYLITSSARMINKEALRHW